MTAEGQPFEGKNPTRPEMVAFLGKRGLGAYAEAEVTPMPPLGDGTPGPLADKLLLCASDDLLKFGPRIFDLAVKDLLTKAGVEVEFDLPAENSRPPQEI